MTSHWDQQSWLNLCIFFLIDGPMHRMGLLRGKAESYNKTSVLRRSSAAAAAKGNQALNLMCALNLGSAVL